jgi:asparagine synthase (glutamine-hydrolysing)
MPGIAGILGRDLVSDSDLDRMIEGLAHKPSYNTGKYVNKELGVYVGWGCHDRSFADCMPIWNETRDVCLLFSGEDFQSSADVTRLKQTGHRFEPSNASYLVHLYEELDLKFIETLNGWFSGLLIDLRNRTATLFNDRYGLGRIYCCEINETLYFSSEAKSLLKVLPQLRQLDLRGVAETFSCGSVLQNRTLFSGISLLPGGSLWTFSQGERRKTTYFQPERWESLPTLSPAQFYGRLKETFGRILPKYFRGTEQIGMSLTGGLDGRLILACMDHVPAKLPCYTFGSTYRNCKDVTIARRLAKLCDQSHQTIVVGKDFLAQFPRLAEEAVYVSDGAMDVTGAAELYVNRIAREIAPVRLTGNYGSEIMRGSVAFRPSAAKEEFLNAEIAQLVRGATDTYLAERRGHKLSFIAFKQVPWHHYSRLSLEQSELTVRSPYLDNEVVSLMYQAPPEDAAGKELCLRLIADCNADLGGVPTDRGLTAHPPPIVGNIQHLWEEFTVRSEYAYDYGMPQWLARINRFIAPLRPERLFLGRHKFCHFRVWYRNELSQYVRDILLDPPALQRPYLRGDVLRNMVNAHISGTRNYTLQIHRALTLELMQRQLLQPS